jgi:hypothetical protein
MITHTVQAITAKVQEIFDAEHKKNYCMGWERYGCIETHVLPDRVEITLNCMYAAPSPTLAVLRQLAEFFGTENINDDDHFANEGCETCDYGSSYGYTLTVRPQRKQSGSSR